MIEMVEKLLHGVYKNGRIHQGYLILEEDANAGNPDALSRVEIRLQNVAEWRVYKFDRAVTINGKECETCLPFLSTMPNARSMCDFIIFYSNIDKPDRINIWVVNLKSGNLGNNAAQLRAGRRMADFIVGKLEDLNHGIKIGKLDFVLFSVTQLYKRTTNPYHHSPSGPSVIGDGTLAKPKNFQRGVTPMLEPI